MWLSNTDKEIDCFHPVCQEALEEALKIARLSDNYIVQHHRHVGTIEMDFVIANKLSKRILCVIEVKRTMAAVNSTRCQYQAMSYVQSLSNAELESKYYLLTNLEASCLFKYDSNRPNVYEQVIEPGICINHRFDEVGKEKFVADLAKLYADFISTAIEDRGVYLLSFKRLADELHRAIDSDKEWKTTLVGLFYEYIRGSFSKILRTGLRTLPQLSNKIDLVCREALQINFADIFDIKTAPSHRDICTDKSLLNQLFELGKTYVDADELASVMHKVISEKHKHEGEVQTDAELATLMLWLVKSFVPQLQPNEIIMDPAAGSGSLLCAAPTVYDGLQPRQLAANDINDRLLQLLSLRIGLKFAGQVQKGNSPKISAINIAQLQPSAFVGVKIIVVNPPYLSAVSHNCPTRKAELYQRIKALTGRTPLTTGGQMPLEGPFLELVSLLAEEGTVIAAILPSSHLTTKGTASQSIRKMLLHAFGLQLIFNYPQEQLFEEVAQNTSIVIGIKGSRQNAIRCLYCNEMVTEIDAKSIKSVLSAKLAEGEFKDINRQFEGAVIPRTILDSTVQSGWILGNMSRQQALCFVRENIVKSELMTELRDSTFCDFQRGKIGNNGCTDLLFLYPNDTFLDQSAGMLEGHLQIGLNRAKDYDSLKLVEGKTRFLDVSSMSDDKILTVVNRFLKLQKAKAKRQRRNEKSPTDYATILKNESKHISPAYSVFLPRSVRSFGRVFMSARPTFVSTNFFVFHTKDECHSKLLASWFSTIFFQLECELFGNNRRGLRKMEKEDYEALSVPDVEYLSSEHIQRILSTPVTDFIDLRSPKPRKVDLLWGSILFGENHFENIEQVCSMLAILVADREK